MDKHHRTSIINPFHVLPSESIVGSRFDHQEGSYSFEIIDIFRDRPGKIQRCGISGVFYEISINAIESLL